MSPLRASQALTFDRASRGSFIALASSLELDPDHVRRFLGPLEEIDAAIRRGPAHGVFAIARAGGVAGFYVLHPDRRDGACWWLGWFAIDRRMQGQGLGRLSLAHIVVALRRIPGCRRVRLMVAPDNAPALQLYRQAGFREIGTEPAAGERILELCLAARAVTRWLLGFLLHGLLPDRRSRQGRLRLSAGPYAARAIGVVRGPPGAPAGLGVS